MKGLINNGHDRLFLPLVHSMHHERKDKIQLRHEPKCSGLAATFQGPFQPHLAEVSCSNQAYTGYQALANNFCTVKVHYVDEYAAQVTNVVKTGAATPRDNVSEN